MKKILCVLALSALVSCGGGSEKHEENTDHATEVSSTPCVDSTEVEMFDENGKSHIVKVPCDSIAK